MTKRQKHSYPVCPVFGKVRFGEHKDATQALMLARRNAQAARALGVPVIRRETRSYRCPACRGWHLTSQESRELASAC